MEPTAKTLEQVIKALVDLLQKSADLRNQAVAIAVAVVWGALAFAVVGLARWEFPSPSIEGPVLIALMLLPLGVYFVASGKLLTAKVPGLEVSFAEKAGKIPTTIRINDTQIVAQGGTRKLTAQARGVDQSRPVVMAITIGGEVKYTVQDVERYLDALLPLRSFKLVVFLDSDERVVAYMEAWRLKELVEQPDTELADELVQFINSGQKVRVTGNPSVTDKMIFTTSTNIEALSEMQEQNLEALVVINEQRMLRGVVERDQVLTRIILSLAR